MDKKLVILLAIVALAIIGSMVWVLASMGGEKIPSNSSPAGSKLTLDNLSDQDKFYFKTTMVNQAVLYNTYRNGNYRNLDTLASQSSPALAQSILAYKQSLEGETDNTLSFSATASPDSFALTFVDDNRAVGEVDMTVKSTRKGSISTKQVHAVIELVKVQDSWKLNTVEYK